MNEKVNILFYIPSLPQEFGGVRQYTAGLVRLFDGLADQFNFFIYHDGKDPNIMNIISEHSVLTLVKPEEFKFSKISSFTNKVSYHSGKLLNRLLNKSILGKQKTELDSVINLFDIDIIHCPYQLLPDISHADKRKVKRIVTMHDVQELHFPEFFSAKDRALRAVNYMNYIHNADKVVVSYTHIKEDIIKFFNKEESKIAVLLLKMDNLWFKKFEKSPLEKIAIFDKYLFYPANFWKHKNHTGLLEVIHYLKTSRNVIVKLILTGDINTSEGLVIDELILKYDLLDQVKILGVVDEKKLYNLYKNAVGVVVPTLYEAGSFPLMESILMEVPVICSNVTSLPETIGDERFIFDPSSLEGMANKIEMLWKDEEFRFQSVENNKKRQARLIHTNADLVLRAIYGVN